MKATGRRSALALLGAGLLARPAWAQGRTIVEFGRAQGRPAERRQPRVRGRAARLGAGLCPGARCDGRLDSPAVAGREGIPDRAGARPAGDRPADRPRRHGEPRAPGGGQARSRGRFRLGDGDLRVAGQSRAGADRHSLRPDRRQLCRHAGVAPARRRHPRAGRRAAPSSRPMPKRPSPASTRCWRACRPTSGRASTWRAVRKAWRRAAAARSTPRSSSASAASTSPRAWAGAATPPTPRSSRSSPGSPTSSSRSIAPSIRT